MRSCAVKLSFYFRNLSQVLDAVVQMIQEEKTVCFFKVLFLNSISIRDVSFVVCYHIFYNICLQYI